MGSQYFKVERIIVLCMKEMDCEEKDAEAHNNIHAAPSTSNRNNHLNETKSSPTSQENGSAESKTCDSTQIDRNSLTQNQQLCNSNQQDSNKSMNSNSQIKKGLSMKQARNAVMERITALEERLDEQVQVRIMEAELQFRSQVNAKVTSTLAKEKQKIMALKKENLKLKKANKRLKQENDVLSREP